MKKVFAAAALAALSTSPVQAEELFWNGTIKQVFEKQCSSCHGSGAPEYAAFKKDREGWISKGVGMRMDTYSHLISFVGWPNTGALMRRLDDGSSSKEGKPGNMYRYLGADEQERQANLTLFKHWVGSWNLKRWSDVSREELDGIKARY